MRPPHFVAIDATSPRQPLFGSRRRRHSPGSQDGGRRFLTLHHRHGIARMNAYEETVPAVRELEIMTESGATDPINRPGREATD
jgi:hypothetical protein